MGKYAILKAHKVKQVQYKRLRNQKLGRQSMQVFPKSNLLTDQAAT